MDIRCTVFKFINRVMPHYNLLIWNIALIFTVLNVQYMIACDVRLIQWMCTCAWWNSVVVPDRVIYLICLVCLRGQAGHPLYKSWKDLHPPTLRQNFKRSLKHNFERNTIPTFINGWTSLGGKQFTPFWHQHMQHQLCNRPLQLRELIFNCISVVILITFSVHRASRSILTLLIGKA